MAVIRGPAATCRTACPQRDPRPGSLVLGDRPHGWLAQRREALQLSSEFIGTHAVGCIALTTGRGSPRRGSPRRGPAGSSRQQALNYACASPNQTPTTRHAKSPSNSFPPTRWPRTTTESSCGYPVAEPTDELAGHAERKTGLTNPADTGQRHETMPTKQRHHLGDLARPSQEGRLLHGKVVSSVLERTQRRVIPVIDLEQRFGLLQILQAAQAHGTQRQARDERGDRC